MAAHITEIREKIPQYYKDDLVDIATCDGKHNRRVRRAYNHYLVRWDDESPSWRLGEAMTRLLYYKAEHDCRLSTFEVGQAIDRCISPHGGQN